MGVIIINQGWTDNLGDVAIGKTLKKELKDFHPFELQFAPIMAKPAQTTGSRELPTRRFPLTLFRKNMV